MTGHASFWHNYRIARRTVANYSKEERDQFYQLIRGGVLGVVGRLISNMVKGDGTFATGGPITLPSKPVQLHRSEMVIPVR